MSDLCPESKNDKTDGSAPAEGRREEDASRWKALELRLRKENDWFKAQIL